MSDLYDDSWKLVPCKLSLSGINKGGYSYLYLGKGKYEYAHRLAWKQSYGTIPDGLEICHKCQVRNCTEPLHLFSGTHKNNMEDASNQGTLGEYNRNKTHCIQGHEFTPENTYNRSDGYRDCKSCLEIHRRKWRQRNE